MNKINLFTCCLITILISLSCKSSKSSTYIEKQSDLLSLNKSVIPKEVIGRVESIKLVQNVFDIMIEDSLGRKYQILSKKVNASSQNKEIVVGEIYKFKITQLTHLNVNNQPNKMVVNGKEITVSPNHYIQDCIKFNGQEFCSNSWEVYEGINLTNLIINN
ncbi:MAG: hypothetical protein GKR88_19340 [Flavobacteriaceae bacterium]|nr:MAG: hypothetical protein GKR88_19340 [Flavobacteriaceae bacterium]